jgi:hypothetical protein
MQSFKKTFDHLVEEKPSQLVLGVVFFFYILFNVQTPLILATPLDTLFGKVLVFIIAAVIFLKTNPVVGVLGFIVAYQMLKTASVTTGTYGIKHYLPSEKHKLDDMEKFNAVEPTSEVAPSSISTSGSGILLAGTLEEEMVDKMAPLVIKGNEDSTLDYKPILDGQHGASSLVDL